MQSTFRSLERLFPRLVAPALALATALALLMAALAPINDRPELWRGPPDEYSHRAAARYYLDHWLPPRVGDPATIESYSRDYGFSYINDPDLVYFFAGKFAKILSPIVANPDRALRLFNVALLAILAAACFAAPRAYLVFVPLLLSPQVWYVFSYFNGDAFPLFLSVLIGAQIVDSESRFNRFLSSPRLAAHWSGPILVGLLLAFLLLSKKNYLAFVGLVPAMLALVRFDRWSAWLLGACALGASAVYLGWVHVDRDALAAGGAIAAVAVVVAILWARPTRRERAVTMGKLALCALVAVAIIAPRYWWDFSLHGTMEQKQLAISKVQEQVAAPAYKPSTLYSRGLPRDNSFYGIEMRARGIDLAALLMPPWSWATKTFSTATGSYGWIEYYAPLPFYVAMLAAYLATLSAYAWGAVRSRRPNVVASFALVCAFSLLTVEVALYASWVYDFQAQGRYLFPIVAMLGMGLHVARAQLPPRAFPAAVVACFALALYSFLAIGLRQVIGSF